jgi:nucleoside-diphosphate-sugar epimerase
MTRLLCIGMGYAARCLARRLAMRDWQVAGTAREDDGVRGIEALGFEALRYDGTEPSRDLRAAIAAATHVLASAPPDKHGDPTLRHHAGDLAAAPRLEWVGYLSTVGIYGDHQGGWVSEDTPPRPISERSRRRLAAENAWLDLSARCRARVELFRLAGIYGPGRSVVDDLRRGSARRIVKPGQVFNRVHVEDIATVLEAAIRRPTKHRIYNVADDEPAESEAVLLYAAALLKVPPPSPTPFADAQLSPMGRSFYAECKRVSNQRVKSSLGIRLKFPTFRDGLESIVASGAQ